MSSSLNRIKKSIMASMQSASKQGTSAYDTTAVVRRIEGDTAWVHIAGGVDETPVKLTIAAKAGDTVQVRVGGGRAWITGNASAPPTDDGTAIIANANAESAKKMANNALKDANIAMAEANALAVNMAQTVLRIDSDISDLQDQVDGNITTWFYAYVPTTSNMPASQWISEGTEDVHLGDLFYNTITGYAYRWMSDGTNYSWLKITDTDVTKALADAAAAQDTADSKRRVFYTTPTTPYDLGDLWVQGPSGDILRCAQAKAESGSYSASDWVLASKYTDDTVANRAESKAYQALVTAGNAEDIAEAQSQHFWTDSDGVHIASEAETPAATRNSLWNSLGMLFRNGLNNIVAILTGSSEKGLAVYDGQGNNDSNVVAKIVNSFIRLGKASESHFNLDYHSLQMIDKEGNSYFYVSDLRGSDGYATITEHSTGDGSTKRFSVKLTPSSVESVTVNDISQTEGTDYSRNGILFTFTNAPASGAVITITYKTTSHLAKAFTIGKRNADNYVAPYSLAEGYLTTASGIYSHAEGAATIASGGHAHAEGLSSTASGDRSHAEGNNALSSGHFSHAEGLGTTASGSASHAQNFGTIAGYANQTAIGMYNNNKSGNLLEIGNGSGNNNRSNAFEVDTNGKVTAGNIVTDGYIYLTTNGKQIFFKDASGDSRSMIWINGSNYFGLGYGMYEQSYGETRIYGDTLRMYSHNAIIMSQPLKVGGHSSAIGTVLTANDTISNLASNTDIARNTNASISLGAGSWVVTGTARYTSNATGRRGINLYVGTSGYESTWVTIPAVSGTTTKVQTTLATFQDEDFVVYMGLQQNSGSALNVDWYLRAIRIA